MTADGNGFSKIIYLSFPPETSGRPVVCNLAMLFDLRFNILKADISPRHEGSLTLEVSGREENYQKGLSYLKENGVKITPASQKVSRDEDACMHCGLCTSLCRTKALSVDLTTRKVLFDVDRCSACGICTRVCPVRAMIVDMNDDDLS
ncbi:4Fe-4S dicluster domain-containing protein [Humidesulfovibrio mexicanus]|uniref:4Fe-4S dicluster domain-containing protein n=1 Tax=Humidesulfovibrio mexicanus TaxID=147047 RepID=A0A238XVZ6_9BACT|nr:NIL domain-containing protein [Humidesulfovibrio mexicanus]SNR62701.1 4Fe-4S dicluster domain-containing protein [Humidesulfovibrio mexicanus]